MTRNYKSRMLAMACLVLLVAVMGGCKKENRPFKVKVELQGLGSQQVKVVYSGADGGIVDYWIKCENNAFEIEGNCANPSLLMVYNKMNVAIVKLMVAGGDNLEVKGKILEPYNLRVKGSEMAEQYNDFMVKHKMEYQNANSEALNTAIEKFVNENPKSVVATVLVMLDYSPGDDSKIDNLLEKIDDSAKPKPLVESYNMLKARSKKPATKITSLNIFEQSSGDFQVAHIKGDKPSIIFFWDREMGMNDRKTVLEELKMLDASLVQVMDISIDIDSTGWYYATHQNGGTSWKHYWVPGSMMNGEIVALQINSIPTIIVTDSLGNQQYRGDDAVIARQHVENML